MTTVVSEHTFRAFNNSNNDNNIEKTQTIKSILPNDRIYSIQMGNEVIKLSGASLNSDSPNLFTDFFSEKENHSTSTIFIDRNLNAFHLIQKHLQGYFFDIKNETEYATLLNDAVFYKFEKLITNIKESQYFYANIGGKSFKFLKKLFRRDGDTGNYFQIYSNTINSQLEYRFIENKLPIVQSISPNYISRSPEYFQLLLDLLTGATIKLTSELRESLIKECKYYCFLNLEQRLIKTKIGLNPFSDVGEITIHLDDIHARGLTVQKLEKNLIINSNHQYMNNRAPCKEDSKLPKECSSSTNSNSSSDNEYNEPSEKKRKLSETQRPWDMIRYKRPFIDNKSNELIFQIDSYENKIIFNKNNKIIHIDICGNTLKNFDKNFNSFLLHQNINLNDYKRKFASNKGNREIEHLVLPACISISNLQVNGIHCRNICQLITDAKWSDYVFDLTDQENKKYSPGLKLYLTKSLWKLGVKDGKLLLIAIKIESFSGIKEYNKLLDFI